MILTVELVALIAGPVTVAVGVVLWFMREIAKVRKEAAVAAAENADRIAAHKLYAANNFVTKSGLTDSLNRVHDSVDHLADRIDELMRQLTLKNGG